MPYLQYMEKQTELEWRFRGILADWLIQVHARLRLFPETLYLAMNVLDRFLSARTVSLAKLQLAGMACMMIAAKYEEVIVISPARFCNCAENNYLVDDLCRAERYILRTLNWNLSYPNPLHFLRRGNKADDFNIVVSK